MTLLVSTTWKCDTPFCDSRVTAVGHPSPSTTARAKLDGWTYGPNGTHRCDKCNLGRCPGWTGGRDHFGDRCPCVHPNGHDGVCQCKHHMAGDAMRSDLTEIMEHLELEAIAVVDRGAVTRGQRLVIRNLLLEAKDEIESLRDALEMER